MKSHIRLRLVAVLGLSLVLVSAERVGADTNPPNEDHLFAWQALQQEMISGATIASCSDGDFVSSTQAAVSRWNSALAHTTFQNSCSYPVAWVTTQLFSNCGYLPSPPYPPNTRPEACVDPTDPDVIGGEQIHNPTSVRLNPALFPGAGDHADGGWYTSAVITHEFGHVLGHDDYAGCAPGGLGTVMDRDHVCINPATGRFYETPQAQDVTNYNEAYRPNGVTSFTGSSPGPGQVQLSWNPSNVHAEAVFRINRWPAGQGCCGTVVGTAAKNASSITLYNQPSGNQTYRVRGWTYALNNGYGDNPSPQDVTVNVQPLLYDDFNSGSINTSLWGTTVGGGATIVQSGGSLQISIPPAANAYADLYSKNSFAVGTTFEARVWAGSGQSYDHKGIGYANTRVGADCGSGETQAAMWRGQDRDKYTETKTSSSSYRCERRQLDYPSGWRTIKVERVSSSQVKFYETGASLGTHTVNIPTGSLPIRFSGYTYTSAPQYHVTIWVDWVKVTKS